MSRHLYATYIYSTTALAKDVNHDGKPYVNKDYPVGTILAMGIDREWYKYVGPSADGQLDPKSWPKPKDDKIQLFRDYWNIIDGINGDNSAPYFKAILRAPKKLIVSALPS